MNELGTICEKCSGVGTWEESRLFHGEKPGGKTYNTTRLCESCHGAGLLPTEFGGRLLDFMRKFLKKTRVRCPKCDGSGREGYYNNDCHYCDDGYRTTLALWEAMNDDDY